MRYKKTLLVLLGLVALGLAACGGDDSDELVISDAYITTSSGEIAALYFTVDNDGDADTLIEVTTEVPSRATFHRNIIEGASTRMEALQTVDIPAHGEFSFVPADYHVMLDGIEEPLEAGSTINITAKFEHAGERTFEAEVRGTGTADTNHDEHEDHQAD